MRTETLRCPDAVSKWCWFWTLIPRWYLAKVTKIHANCHLRKCPSQKHSESPTHSPKHPTSKIIHFCQLKKSCSCHQELDQTQGPAKERDAEISKGYSLACIVFVAVNIIVFSDPKPLGWNFSSARAKLCPSSPALPSWQHTSAMGRAPATAALKDCHTLHSFNAYPCYCLHHKWEQGNSCFCSSLHAQFGLNNNKGHSSVPFLTGFNLAGRTPAPH